MKNSALNMLGNYLIPNNAILTNILLSVDGSELREILLRVVDRPGNWYTCFFAYSRLVAMLMAECMARKPKVHSG